MKRAEFDAKVADFLDRASQCMDGDAEALGAELVYDLAKFYKERQVASALDEYAVRVAIGDACYGQGFVETGEFNKAFRSGAALGAWIAQEFAKQEDKSETALRELACRLAAQAFKNGTVRCT